MTTILVKQVILVSKWMRRHLMTFSFFAFEFPVMVLEEMGSFCVYRWTPQLQSLIHWEATLSGLYRYIYLFYGTCMVHPVNSNALQCIFKASPDWCLIASCNPHEPSRLMRYLRHAFIGEVSAKDLLNMIVRHFTDTILVESFHETVLNNFISKMRV